MMVTQPLVVRNCERDELARLHMLTCESVYQEVLWP
jgi:hypothetical protein